MPEIWETVPSHGLSWKDLCLNTRVIGEGQKEVLSGKRLLTMEQTTVPRLSSGPPSCLLQQCRYFFCLQLWFIIIGSKGPYDNLFRDATKLVIYGPSWNQQKEASVFLVQEEESGTHIIRFIQPLQSLLFLPRRQSSSVAPPPPSDLSSHTATNTGEKCAVPAEGRRDDHSHTAAFPSTASQ